MTQPNPTDFGTDTSCVTSLRTGRYATGVRLVAERIYRRFITPLGMLQGGDAEQNFGMDLVELIGTVTGPSTAASIPGQIQAEALKDEEITACTVTMSSVVLGPSTTWTINITCETGKGPFSLVLAVSNVSVQLLGITPGI